MSAFLNEFPGFPSFVKGGIIHDEQGARLKLLEQLFFEVVIEYEGIEVPLKKQWGEESFSLGCGRDEVGSRSASSVTLPKNLASLEGPCPRALGRTLKPGFIKINSATGAMPHKALPQVCQVFDSAGEISFTITRLFFFRVALIRLRACRMELVLTLKWATRSRWRASG